VQDPAELAGLDHLAGEPHGGHEPVVERAHVLDPGRLDALPRLVALVRVTAERLLADHVLARLGRGDRRLRVEVVRPDVVEQANAVVVGLMDSTKFERASLMTIRSATELDLIITDDRLDPEVIEAFRVAGVNLQVATGAAEVNDPEAD
jgi:hypothetical protein